MTRRTMSLDNRLYDYLLGVGVNESPALARLREETANHRLAKMQLAPEQGALLQWLVRLTGARRYLEIGVFTGYSSLAVAEALPEDGQIVACDVSDTLTQIAREHWRAAGVDGKIELRLKPALETLAELLQQGQAGRFDIALIDADKPNTPAYFEACLELVRAGGVIAIDNVFLNGRVADPQPDGPPGVGILAAFNAALIADPRVDVTVLPMGDGLTLAHVRG
ncbi:class I SAM-dependent methyltransferase [Crenobacter cavernae]|uniref:Methyltransferase domain-containing protein n=1 Tax=Crenobacter cavernae TaxID=2290923 RepID=A0ABY0FHR6_9NEIS|nr:class I SAM-dependent methyltransferase [Crenobacter cavernae]RXZ44535.1 methyltransferase domain-containing protein [Crenobacter cavernae]